MSTSTSSRLLTVGLLWIAFSLALTSAVQKSPTMDEQNHIARGAAYLGTGDPRLSIEHPPLVNVLSALPAHLLLDLNLPLDEWWEAGEWYHFADHFLWQANAHPDRIVFLSRLPIIGLGLILVALVFQWADARFGPWGGLLAAAVCALDPNILAHTRLSTTDVGGTCFILLAAYALWRASAHPSWLRTLGSGVAFGLALSAKLSNLLFGPIFALTLLADALAGGQRHLRARAMRNLALLASTVFIGLLIVWAVYGFQVGRLTTNGPPVPAPPYVKGVRAILDFSTGGRPAYLLGQYSHQGWWYYFPVAFAVKTPPATLIALLLATWRLVAHTFGHLPFANLPSDKAPLPHNASPASRRVKDNLRDDLPLLIPPAIYFIISMTSSLNIGYRHLLPVLPFIAIHIARLAPLPAPPRENVPQSRPSLPSAHSSPTHQPSARPPLARLSFTHLSLDNLSFSHLLLALVAWLALSTLFIHPHFLAYFNFLGGGPQNGWHILADSNIDWGQDLKGLQAWMAREGVGRVKLSWFGSARPEAYAIPYDLLPGVPHGFTLWEDPPFNREQPEPGIYAISVTNLLGVVFPDHDIFAWFRARPPDAKIGYSLFIYEVVDDG